MKEEEFNDFLRDRADSFELKPSSGSFDAVARKMRKQKKRRGAFFIITLLLLGASATILNYAVNNTTENSGIAQQIISEENNQKSLETSPQPNKSVSANADEVNGIATATDAEANNPEGAYNAMRLREQNSKRISTADNGTSVPSDRGATKESKNQEVVLANSEINKPETEINNKQPVKETLLAEQEQKTEQKKNGITPAEEKEVSSIEKDRKTKETKKDSNNFCNCAEKKWAVKAYVNPFLSSYVSNTSVGNRGGTENVIDFQQLNSQPQSFTKEQPNNGISWGINFERKLAKKFSLGFGVAYSKWDLDFINWTEEYRRDSIVNYRFDVTTNQYVPVGVSVSNRSDAIDSTVTNVAFQSVQIPVYVSFNVFNKKRFSLDIQTGFTGNYIYNTTFKRTEKILNTRTPNQNESIRQYKYRSFNVTYDAGIITNYTIGKCWGIYGGPNIGIPLLPIHETGNNEKRRPLFLSFQAGVRFKF
jgi:hypothetical protein